MSISIRFLKKKELNLFQNLVKKSYPKKKYLEEHIFEKNSDVIKFYYNYFDHNKLKILGLFSSGNLVAAQGLITYDNWDSKLKKIFYLAFTVKSSQYKKDCLIMFLQFIYNLNPNFLATVGTNMFTAGMILNKISKIKNLDHYYICNPILKQKISKFLILKKPRINSRYKNLQLYINKNISNLPKKQYKPKKTKKYFINKYLRNPFYEYFVMHFYQKRKLLFFFICREIFIKSSKSKILRIIDFCGNFPKKVNIYNCINDFLKKNNIEYIDFLIGGINSKAITEIGFIKKTKKNIIPNHFEPLDYESNYLNYGIFINKFKSKIVTVKGDGDQDRPNLLKKK